MDEKPNNIIDSIRKMSHSHGATIVMQFLLFVVISFMFWAVNELNDNTQEYFLLKFELVNKPDSIKIISVEPEPIKVSLQDNGLKLIKYKLSKWFWGSYERLKVDFKENAKDGVFKMSYQQLNDQAQKVFGNESVVKVFDIDSIHLKYTDLPGVIVPVRLDVAVVPDGEHVLAGRITLSQDSVMVFGTRESLMGVNEVYTLRIEEKEQKDTFSREVGFAPLKDVRIEPAKIKLTVPVEPLVDKKVSTIITVRNLPPGVNVLTFPSTTKITYNVPRSVSAQHHTITAIVDYEEINKHPERSKLHVRVGEVPAVCKDVNLDVDSVEFLIEKKLIPDEP